MFWLLTASFIWAFSFGLIKGTTGHVDPFVLSAVRMVGAFVVALVFFRPGFVPRAQGRKMMLAGFFQLGLMYAPYMLSFRFLKAYEVALFTMTSPLFVILIEQIRRRVFSLRIIFAAMLAVVGGGIVAWKNPETTDLLTGVALVQLSNLLFACGQSLVVSGGRITSTEALRTAGHYFFGAMIGSLICLACAWLSGSITEQVYTQRDWLVFGWLGVVSTGIGFVIWNLGAARVSFGELGVATAMKLPMAVLVSLIVFGEQADSVRVVAGAIVLTIAARVARGSLLQPK